MRELTISVSVFIRLPPKVDGSLYVVRSKDIVPAFLVTARQIIDGVRVALFDLSDRSWGRDHGAYEERRSSDRDVFHVD